MHSRREVAVAVVGGAAGAAAVDQYCHGAHDRMLVFLGVAVVCVLAVWPVTRPLDKLTRIEYEDPDMIGDILTPEWRDTPYVPYPRDPSDLLIWPCGNRHPHEPHIYELGPYHKKRQCRGDGA